MEKKKLNQYQKELSATQVANGINCAIKNARRLILDSELLLEKKRFPSALGLAILAIEEAGKVPILRELSVAKNAEELKTAWKAYRSHTKKNVMWIFYDLFKSGARKLEDFRPIVDKDSEHPYILDNVKQICFYTDCLGNAHWSAPDEIIEEGLAREIVNLAKSFVPKKEVDEKEIALWIKHIGPILKSDFELMKVALQDWYYEMKLNGLYEGSLDDAFQFVGGERFWKH